MLKRLTFSLLLLFGAWANGAPAATAQALLPYTLPLDPEGLQTDGESLARDAAQLAQFQQYDEALARAQLAAQLLPGDPDILALLGSLYLQVNDPQLPEAISALNRAKELQPDNPLVLFTLGSAYFGQEDYAQAAQSIEAGLKLEPDNYKALFDLGNAYYRLAQFDKAIAQYEKAIESQDDFWPAINNIGLVVYEQGDAEGAISHWEKALSIADEADQTEPQLAIAVARYSQGTQQMESSDSAIAALERDPRYADIEFLQSNLWGDKLITATQQLFNTPSLQEILVQL